MQTVASTARDELQEIMMTPVSTENLTRSRWRRRDGCTGSWWSRREVSVDFVENFKD